MPGGDLSTVERPANMPTAEGSDEIELAKKKSRTLGQPAKELRYVHRKLIE